MTNPQSDLWVAPLELRFADESSGGRTLTGIVVPYGVTSMIGPFADGERFMKGAFKRSAGQLKGGKVVKLFRAHDHSRAIGLASKLWEADEGLMGEFRFATTSYADEARDEVRQGLLDAFSVGFRAIRDRMTAGVREVLEADILEASLAPLPVYEAARVLSLRSATALSPIVLPPMPTVDLSPLPVF